MPSRIAMRLRFDRVTAVYKALSFAPFRVISRFKLYHPVARRLAVWLPLQGSVYRVTPFGCAGFEPEGFDLYDR